VSFSLSLFPVHMRSNHMLLPNAVLCPLGSRINTVKDYRQNPEAAAMIQGDLATTQGSSRPWCHPHDACFVGMQNTKVMSHGGYHLDFKRNPRRPGNVW
jgi:hypothetical protein